MDIRKYTSSKIKEYRKLAGLTQKELGEKIGVKHNTVSGYENGTNEPEQDILFKIAEVLRISINDLFPPTTTTTNKNTLSPKDEREINEKIEEILSNMDTDTSLTAYGGTIDSDEDKELIRNSLEQALKLAKRAAKEKFTPHKYRK